MSEALSRSLSPRSIAMIGPADELSAVIGALRAFGYAWELWPVTETGTAVAGLASVAGIAALPGAPDLAYVGLRGAPLRAALEALAERGAGGAVCPHLDAAGLAELADLAPLPLPVFAGGLLSALSRLPLWPGVEAIRPTARGPALLLSETGRLARFLSLRHGLPLACAVPLGGAAGPGLLPLAAQLLADERVTVLAIQADGPPAPPDCLELGRLARQHGKAVIYWSRRLGPGPAALLQRAGIAHVEGPAALVEALWILHLVGPLPANALAAMACGPGLVDWAKRLAAAQGLCFAPLGPRQREGLARALPPGRAVDNPLDCAGLTDGDAVALARVFTEMMLGDAVLSLAVIRHVGEGGWTRAAQAAALAREHVGMPLALLAPNRAEMTEARALELLKAGVIPLAGLSPSVEALRAAIEAGRLAPGGEALLLPRPGAEPPVVTGGAAVGALFGLDLQAGEPGVAPMHLGLSADPGFGYLAELAAPAGARAAGLLPLSPRACRDLAAQLGLGEGQAEALAALLGAVQAHVAASDGAVAGLEIALDLGHNGPARARHIELRAWSDTDHARRRTPSD